MPLVWLSQGQAWLEKQQQQGEGQRSCDQRHSTGYSAPPVAGEGRKGKWVCQLPVDSRTISQR